MAVASQMRTDWTVAELQQLPDDGNRYEIIDGVLYVTPAPRLLHQAVLGEFFFLLKPYGKLVGLGVLLSPADITFSDRTLVQPDLFAFPAPQNFADFHYTDITHLELAIEILSPSTARVDRSIKRRLYQRQGVDEYWVVDADTRSVERWRPDSVEGDRITGTLLWHPRPAHAALTIDLPTLFRDVLGE
jgi:Uma2 family endonuclease